MQKAGFLFLLVVMLVLAAFMNPPHHLEGRWEFKQKTANGTFSLLAIFRPDNTYDGFINGKAFVTGKYMFGNDTLHIADPICNTAYYGTYRVEFITVDSIRFHVFADTCTARREGTDGFAFKRIK